MVDAKYWKVFTHMCTHMLYMNQARPHTHTHIHFSCQRSGEVFESQKCVLSIPALLPKIIRTSSQIAYNFFLQLYCNFQNFLVSALTGNLFYQWAYG